MDLKLRNNALLSNSNFDYYADINGICNIDTGVSVVMQGASTTAANIITVKCKVKVLSATDYAGIYSAYNGEAYQAFRLIANNGSVSTLLANSYSKASSPLTLNSISGILEIKHSYSSITINGTSFAISPSGSNTTVNLKIASGNMHYYLWNMQIYKGGVLVRDYIPKTSNETNHIGEGSLYDKVNNVYYYSTSTGTINIIGGEGMYDNIISAYIKDCPNISGIELLRKAVNLQRIRCDIGNISGTVTELLRYTVLAGFTDNYEEQQIPRIVGTWTINGWYTNEELENFQGAIDGLTVLGDGTHNVETALENGDLAVQTIDSTKPNYNPAAAIRLNANGYGHITTNRIVNNGGKFFIGKNEASIITTLPVDIFRGITTVVDENSIVTNDNEAEYNFDSFDEFKYFTGITTITAGSSTTALGLFGGCTKLSSIKIPHGVTTIGAYAFYDCTALSGNLILPDTVTTIGSNSLHNIPNVSDVYIPGNFSNSCINSVNNMTDNVLGDNTGILNIKGNHSGANVAQIPSLRFTKIFVYGNISAPRYMYSSSTFCIRVKGSANITGYALISANGYFFEVMSNITKGTNGTVFVSTSVATNNKTICHLGYNNLVSIPCNYFGVAKTSMIYVGDGSSRANDEAILALYLADTNWSTYSAKLGTWWDYNGEYKWYYITDNLTNCTNTNPVDWPHITRG